MTSETSEIKNLFASTNTKVSNIRFVKESKNHPKLEKKSKVRLALISLPNYFSTNHIINQNILTGVNNFAQIDAETCDRCLSILSGDALEELISNYVTALHVAASKLEADIICFNELGYPSNNDGPVDLISQITNDYSNEHGCVIVAGSYHDVRTNYNSGKLYIPSRNVTSSSEWYYHKQLSAIRLKVPELISIPPKRSTIAFEAFGLKIAVLICLDVVDFATIASLVQADMDLLLIPSFTDRTDTLKQTAEFISKCTGGKVALINYNDEFDTSGFLFKFGEKKKLTIETDDDVPWEIHWRDIQVRDFIDERNNYLATQDAQLKWLFQLDSPLNSLNI